MEWLQLNLSTIAICAFTVALMLASLYTAARAEGKKRRLDAAERARYRRALRADLYAAAIDRQRVADETSKTAGDAVENVAFAIRLLGEVEQKIEALRPAEDVEPITERTGVVIAFPGRST